MYKLFYSPGACSMAVHVVLNEAGQSCELINTSLSEGKNRDPEFLKLNPRAQVPVLVEDGKALREGAAQITYLCDKHGLDLLPKSGWERAKALEWLAYANSSLHPAYGRVFWLSRSVKDDAVKKELMDAAVAQLTTMWADIESALANSPYLCGSACTAADILVTVIANWGQWLPSQPVIGPRAKALFAKVIARPAYQKALAAEQVEYKAAA